VGVRGEGFWLYGASSSYLGDKCTAWRHAEGLGRSWWGVPVFDRREVRLLASGVLHFTSRCIYNVLPLPRTPEPASTVNSALGDAGPRAALLPSPTKAPIATLLRPLYQITFYLTSTPSKIAGMSLCQNRLQEERYAPIHTAPYTVYADRPTASSGAETTPSGSLRSLSAPRRVSWI
jgi:hypothetical protein